MGLNSLEFEIFCSNNKIIVSKYTSNIQPNHDIHDI